MHLSRKDGRIMMKIQRYCLVSIKPKKEKGTVRQFINYILSTLTGELAMSMVIEPKWTLAGEKETIRRINFSKKKLYWFLKKNNCR